MNGQLGAPETDPQPRHGDPIRGAAGCRCARSTPTEWQALVDKGKADGTVHAEEVTLVLRDVELNPEVLAKVQVELSGLGIVIDESLDDDRRRRRCRRRSDADRGLGSRADRRRHRRDRAGASSAATGPGQRCRGAISCPATAFACTSARSDRSTC